MMVENFQGINTTSLASNNTATKRFATNPVDGFAIWTLNLCLAIWFKMKCPVAIMYCLDGFAQTITTRKTLIRLEDLLTKWEELSFTLPLYVTQFMHVTRIWRNVAESYLQQHLIIVRVFKGQKCYHVFRCVPPGPATQGAQTVSWSQRRVPFCLNEDVFFKQCLVKMTAILLPWLMTVFLDIARV